MIRPDEVLGLKVWIESLGAVSVASGTANTYLDQANSNETTTSLPPKIQQTILDFVSHESAIGREDLVARLNVADKDRHGWK